MRADAYTGMELRKLAADLMRERDQFRDDLERVSKERDEAREAHGALIKNYGDVMDERNAAIVQRDEAYRSTYEINAKCNEQRRRADKAERERDEARDALLFAGPSPVDDAIVITTPAEMERMASALAEGERERIATWLERELGNDSPAAIKAIAADIRANLHRDSKGETT